MKKRFFAALIASVLFGTGAVYQPAMADLSVDSGKTETFTSNTFADGTIILNGGTLVKGYLGEAVVANPVVVNDVSGNTINTGTNGHFVLSGPWTGSGTVTQTGSLQLHFLNADNSGFSGTVVSTSSWLSFRNVGAASENATYQINTTGVEGIVFADTDMNVDPIIKLGMLAGTNASAEIRVSTNGGVSNLNRTLQIGGNDTDGTFSGKLYKNSNGVDLSIDKVGLGVWTLTSSEHSYTGTTTVSEGTLRLNLASTTATGIQSKVFEVKAGATLDIVKGLVGNNGTGSSAIVDGTVIMGNGTDVPAKLQSLDWTVGSTGKVVWNQTTDWGPGAGMTMTFNGGTVDVQTGRIVLKSVITGSELTKIGAGDLFFQDEAVNLSTDLQQVNVNGGRLILKRTHTGDVDVNDGGTFLVGNSSAPGTNSGVVTVNTGGNVRFENDNSVLNGSLIMAGGTLTNKVARNIESLTAMTFQGGTINQMSNLVMPGTLNVESGETTIVGYSGDLYYKWEQTGNMTGSGTLKYETLTNFSNQFQMKGDNSGFSGTVIVSGGGFGGLFGPASASAQATYTLDGAGLFIQSTAAQTDAYVLGALSGKGEFRPGGSHAQAMTDVTLGAKGAGLDTVFTGVINNNGNTKFMNLTIEGGTYIASSAWTYGGASEAEATGATVINGGTLQLGNGTAKGVLWTSDITVNANGTLAFNYQDPSVNWDFSKPMTFNGGVLTATGQNLRLGGSVSGTEMIFSGPANLYLGTEMNMTVDKFTLTSGKAGFGGSTGPLVYNGQVQLSGGILSMGHASSRLNGAWILEAGTFNSIAAYEHSAPMSIIGADTNVQFNQTNGVLRQTGAVSGDGTLVFDGNNTMGNQLQFACDTSGFTGKIVSTDNGAVGFYGSQTTQAGASYAVSKGDGSQGGTIFLVSTGSETTPYQMGDLSGDFGFVRAGASSGRSLTTLEVGALGLDSEFGGSIFDYTSNLKMSVTKVGDGIWTMSGSNTYTGDTFVKGGVLNVTGALTSSDVFVNAGGSFSGSGTLGKADDSVTLTFDDGGMLVVDLDQTDSLLKIFGNVDFNPGSGIHVVTSDISQYEGQQIQLFDVTGTADYDVNDMSLLVDGLDTIDTWSLLQDGSLYNLTLTGSAGGGGGGGVEGGEGVPEPSTAVMLILGVLSLMWYRRAVRS